VSARAWDAGAVVARAQAIAAQPADVPHGATPAARAVGATVLKRGPRSVVWLAGTGPGGEDVVVKTMPAGGLLEGLLDRVVGSAGERQRRAAERLLAGGVGVPEVVGVADTGSGRARTSSVVMRAIADAEPVKALSLRLAPRARRRFARALGRFLARLHATGVYVPDLRDANLLARERPDGGFEFVIVDLDRVRRPALGLSARRRRANLIHLDRTLGWVAAERERLAALGAYRRALPAPRPRLGDLARTLDRERRRKDRAVARRRRLAGIVPDERMQISCIVVTGNEIAHIRDCLESVRWCDEIVVIDSFSTDGTLAVCRQYTDRVLRRGWTGYRDQKAYALAQARHPWVLNVDADERVSPELAAEIAEILTSDGRGYDGFTVPRLVHYLGRWWRLGGWYPDRRLRLFRRERATWGGIDPHEHVLLRGRVGRLRGPLWHYTYDDVADHVATIDRFTSIASRSAGARPRRASWSALTLRPIARFVRFYVLRFGWRMGFPGLFAAISAAVYVHLKYAKRDEAARLAGDRASDASAGEASPTAARSAKIATSEP